MKCVICKGQSVRIIYTITIHKTGAPIDTSWQYYCEMCITLGKISGNLQRNPMTYREQWYNEVK
jgi:hypothetical protein